MLALYVMSLPDLETENQTDCEEMIGYLCNKQLSVYEKQRLAEQMKKSKQYLYLGNAFLNGATPANDYTPSQPYSITLTKDSVVDEDQIYIPANPSIPSLISIEPLSIARLLTVVNGSMFINHLRTETGICINGWI